MPPVLGIPLRSGRPRPPTHFRPQPELAPRAKGPLLLIEIENPAINCYEFDMRVFVQLPTGLGAGGAARQAQVLVRCTSPIAVPLNLVSAYFFKGDARLSCPRCFVSFV